MNFIAGSVSIALIVASTGCRQASTRVSGLAHATASLSSGQSPHSVFRKVPYQKALSVISPSQDARMPGIYYARHVVDPNDPAQQFKGLSDGLVMMAPNGIADGPDTLYFPVQDDGNYAFLTKDAVDFTQLPDTQGLGFKVEFSNAATHGVLTQITGFVKPNPDPKNMVAAWSSEDDEFTMEKVTLKGFKGPVWVRRSAMINPLSRVKTALPDYYLVQVGDAKGRPTANYFTYFLPDMAAAGVSDFAIAVNGDSDLAKSGATLPDGIGADDEHLYVDATTDGATDSDTQKDAPGSGDDKASSDISATKARSGGR